MVNHEICDCDIHRPACSVSTGSNRQWHIKQDRSRVSGVDKCVNSYQKKISDKTIWKHLSLPKMTFSYGNE